MIHYTCDHCGVELESPDFLAGQEETCPACGGKVRSPRPRPQREPFWDLERLRALLLIVLVPGLLGGVGYGLFVLISWLGLWTVLIGLGCLAYCIFVSWVVVGIADAAKKTAEKYRVSDRARTTGKRLARWLDKTFSADDPKNGDE